MKFTANQRLAIESWRQDTAVVAGPGSGKTRVLVERYLQVLEDSIGAELETIVAATFTSKAAAEMRERLRSRIDELARTHPDPAARGRWLDRKRRLDSAQITTIHGLAARLLRENPVAAGVDPRFSTLDTFEANRLLDLAAESAVASIAERSTNAGVALISAYSRRGLVEELLRVYRSLTDLGVSVAEARAETCEALGRAPRYGDAVRQLGAAIEDLVATAAARKDWGTRAEPVAVAWDAVRRRISRAPQLSRVRVFRRDVERLRDALPRAAGGLKDAVLAVRALVGDKPGERALEAAFHTATAAAYAREIFTALEALDRTYCAEKRAIGALDYDDLQRRARHLLASDDRAAARARRRVRFLLVDEFQDTNRLQRDIIRLLVPRGSRHHRLFIVGDPKQSIYGFRGAEVDVFDETAREIASSGGIAVGLAENFRSDARLVDWQNAVFTVLFGDRSADDGQGTGQVVYEPGVARRAATDDAPAVELLLSSGETGASSYGERHRDSEARRVAARLRGIVDDGEVHLQTEDGPRPARFGDFGLLLRATTDIKLYERALSRARVPYFVVEGMGFYDRPEVVDMLNLFAFIDNRTDEPALAGVLRSAMFGVSDEALLALRLAHPGLGLFDALTRWEEAELVPPACRPMLDRAVRLLGELAEARGRLPVSALVRRALEITEYDIVAASCSDGDERVANLGKLVGLARSFERRRGSSSLADYVAFVRDARRLGAREAEARQRASSDAVAVLTVHKSKGLEFPIVVMPDLHRRARHEPGPILYDRENGITFRVPDGAGRTAPTSLYARAADALSRREANESTRVFYVGVTRAQERLLLSGVPARGMLEGRHSGAPANWLAAIAKTFDLSTAAGGVVSEGAVSMRVTLPEDEIADRASAAVNRDVSGCLDPVRAIDRVRVLLRSVPAETGLSARRFSATLLSAHAECPRSSYFGRLLRGPQTGGRLDARDVVERGSAARLAPSARGLVIHRFCEIYRAGQPVEERLREALRYVSRARAADFTDGLDEALEDRAVAEILPFAENYSRSRALREVEAHRASGDGVTRVLTETPFVLRTDAGFVTGSIDTLLVTALEGGRVRATVLDFKTERIEAGGSARAAARHRLQMQTYALAARALVPGCTSVEARLVFLASGDEQFAFDAADLTERAATRAVESAVAALSEPLDHPESFPPVPGRRCDTCRFSDVCSESSRQVSEPLETARAHG